MTHPGLMYLQELAGAVRRRAILFASSGAFLLGLALGVWLMHGRRAGQDARVQAIARQVDSALAKRDTATKALAAAHAATEAARPALEASRQQVILVRPGELAIQQTPTGAPVHVTVPAEVTAALANERAHSARLEAELARARFVIVTDSGTIRRQAAQIAQLGAIVRPRLGFTEGLVAGVTTTVVVREIIRVVARAAK